MLIIRDGPTRHCRSSAPARKALTPSHCVFNALIRRKATPTPLPTCFRATRTASTGWDQRSTSLLRAPHTPQPSYPRKHGSGAVAICSAHYRYTIYILDVIAPESGSPIEPRIKKARRLSVFVVNLFLRHPALVALALSLCFRHELDRAGDGPWSTG